MTMMITMILALALAKSVMEGGDGLPTEGDLALSCPWRGCLAEVPSLLPNVVAASCVVVVVV